MVFSIYLVYVFWSQSKTSTSLKNKTKNISWQSLVDSEFKIGCWHVMNLLRTKSVTFLVGISNGLHGELKMISSDLTADKYLAENLNEFVTFLASFKVAKFFIFSRFKYHNIEMLLQWSSTIAYWEKLVCYKVNTAHNGVKYFLN